MVDWSQASDEELLAAINGRPKNKSTIGEDILSLGKNLYQGAKALPGAAKKTGKSILKHPGQAAAGIIPGLASIADIPAFLGNAALATGEYAAKKYYGNNELESPRIPYVGHQVGTGIANLLSGKPQTEEEQLARLGGELGSAFINPGQIAKQAGTKLSAKATSFSPTKYEAFQGAGISPTLGEVSNAKYIQTVEEGLKRSPAGKVFENASEARETALDDLFSRHLKTEKAVSSPGAGEIVKKGAQSYNRKAKDVAEKLYKKAFSHLDPKTAIPLPKTMKAIDESLTAITPQAREILQSTTSGKAFIRLENAIKANHGSLPLGDVRSVYRGAIDDLINTWGEVGSSEQGALKTIRNTLDKEVKETITKYKPAAAKDFARADKFWAGFSDRNKSITNKAIKSENPVSVYNSSLNALKKGDTQHAKVLSQRLDSEGKEILSSSWMQDLGRNAIGEFDANKWAKEYLKIKNKSPESAKILTQGLPESSRAKIDSIAESIGYSKLSKAQANHSGTAYTAALFALPGSLYLAPGTTAGTAAGVYGASKLFTNKKFIDGLYAASKAKTPLQLEKILSKYDNVLPRLETIRESQEQPVQQEQPQENPYATMSDEELLRVLGQ